MLGHFSTIQTLGWIATTAGGFVVGAWTVVTTGLVSAPLYLQVIVIAGLAVVGMSVGLIVIMALGNRVSKPAGIIEKRSARVVSDSQYRAALDTVLTWVYRRRHWAGLSDDGKFTEGAPADYGQKVYDDLGLDARYQWSRRSMAEPDFSGPPEGTIAPAKPIRRWLPNRTDLSSSTLTVDDLDDAVVRATDRALEVLGPDAAVYFSQIEITEDLAVSLSAYSHIATRGLQIVVSDQAVTHAKGEWGPELPYIQDVLEDGKWVPIWEAGEPQFPWRTDSSVFELIRQTGYRLRPWAGETVQIHYGTIRIFPRGYADIRIGKQPADATILRWIAHVTSGPPNRELKTYCLADGKLADLQWKHPEATEWN
jgi:hypothetical protein